MTDVKIQEKDVGAEISSLVFYVIYRSVLVHLKLFYLPTSEEILLIFT